jgi:uncharacterized protein
MKKIFNLLVLLSMGFCAINAQAALTVIQTDALVENCKQGDQLSVQTLKAEAEQGDVNGQFALGFIYDVGFGVPQDFAKSENWYLKAAEQGHAGAQLNLGGKAHYKRDFVKAIKWYRKAAELGNLDAQFNLGVMYKNGQGLPQDYAEAVNWYRKAAEQGSARGQINLGVMYHSGLGVPQDFAEAVNWFRKAAEQGVAEAQYNLGGMYESGQGVAQDFSEAVKWFRKAAEQGDENARGTLAWSYENGQGVPQLRVPAYALYRTIPNNKIAKEKLKGLSEKMESDEINMANTLRLQMLEKGNFLSALDKYVDEFLVKEKAR